MIQIKILYNDGILLPKICILKVHLFPGLHSFDEYSNNTSKELLEQFSGWEEEERGYLTFVKKEVSLFPRDLKNRIGAPLAESLVVEKMQAANYTSRYAFYRPVYRICSIKPLIPRALTDTGFYYVALATKSYKGLCSQSEQQLRFTALSREPRFQEFILLLLLSSSSRSSPLRSS